MFVALVPSDFRVFRIADTIRLPQVLRPNAIDLYSRRLYHPRTHFTSCEVAMSRYTASVYLRVPVLLAFAAVLAVAASHAQQPMIKPEAYEQLKYRYIGPE